MNKGKFLKAIKEHKVLAIFVVAITIMSAITIVFGTQAHTDLIPIDAGNALTASGVNNTLNITFSDVSYTTVAPAFEFQRGNYNTNATWIKPASSTGINVTNSTYLVMQSNASTGLSGLTQVQYDLKDFNKNASYFFLEAKLAENFTSTAAGDISLVLSDSGSSSFLSTANSASAGTGTVVITDDSGVLAATANESSTAYASGTNSGTTTMSALQFYDLSVYVYKDTSTTVDITVAVINPANGVVLGKSVFSGVSGVNISRLNYSAFQFEGDSGAALILDWGYFAFSGTSALATSASIDPFITGSGSNFATDINSNVAPFDPAAANDTSFTHAPNATATHTGSRTSDSDFKSVIASNNTTTEQALLENVTYANFGVGNHTTANGTTMFENLTTLPENSTSFTANIHVSVFNTSGINIAVNNFLKNYTANLATVNSGILYTYRNMTIISYMVSNIQISTNLSAGDAAAVRDTFDNEFPAILAANNLSLVNTTTNGIVAGAFAGDFYYSGMAIVPEIQGNSIIDPVNNQHFSSVEAAGFAAGAYISGGSVIVPQYTIVGYAAGIPEFASGFSLGSLFSSLTSSGAAVEHFLSSGTTTMKNAISTATSTATKDIIKPITATASSSAKNIASDINKLKTEAGGEIDTIIPTLGIVANDVQQKVSGALGPISGAVSDLSSSLASAKDGIVSAVAAGASGVKQDVYSLGTDLKNDTSSIEMGIINTLDQKISDITAVLSPMFTAIKTIPSEISQGVASVASKVKASTLSALDTVGTTLKTTTGGLLTAVKNTYGNISDRITNLAGKISSGATSAFSMLSAFGAKLGYVLEIVGITIVIVAIIGLVLYFYIGSKGKVVKDGVTELSPFTGSPSPMPLAAPGL